MPKVHSVPLDTLSQHYPLRAAIDPDAFNRPDPGKAPAEREPCFAERFFSPIKRTK